MDIPCHHLEELWCNPWAIVKRRTTPHPRCQTAGFCANGKVDPAVTVAFTIVLEGARTTHLENHIQSPMTTNGKRAPNEWSFFTIITQPLGIYWWPDLPSRNNYILLIDKYGTNLSAAALAGQGHNMLHNQLQSLLQSMMKLGGILPEKEAVNILLDKVCDPYITAYVNHVSSHPNSRNAPYLIVPDLHTRNSPTWWQEWMIVERCHLQKQNSRSKRTGHTIAVIHITIRQLSNLNAKRGRSSKRTIGSSKCWTVYFQLML